MVGSPDPPRRGPDGDRLDPTLRARLGEEDGRALTELPSTLARGLAFAAVIVAGLCGALIGYAVAELQCDGSCTLVSGTSAVVGGVIGAIGVGIVAVLVLRAMSEWRSGGR